MVEKSYTKQVSQYIGHAAGKTANLVSNAYSEVKETIFSHGEEAKETAKETYSDVADFSEFSEMVKEDIAVPIENGFGYVSDFFEDFTSGIYEGYQYSANACESGKKCIVESGEKAYDIAEGFAHEAAETIELTGENAADSLGHTEL